MLQKKILTAASAAQALIETAHKKITSASVDMVLNRKQDTKNCLGKKVNNWHAKRETCSKHEKGWRLIDSKRVEKYKLIGRDTLKCKCFALLFCFFILVDMGN